MTLLGSYVRPRESRRVWSGGLVALLHELGFSDGAARIALTRLVRRGLLSRHREGRLVHYSLTARTVALLDDGDRRIFGLGRRDEPAGTWTVLWQNIPETRRKSRERLVRRLRFLGFGPVQDGTWLAPHDREAEVLALLTELEVAEHAGLMLGTPSAALDVQPARRTGLGPRRTVRPVRRVRGRIRRLPARPRRRASVCRADQTGAHLPRIPFAGPGATV